MTQNKLIEAELKRALVAALEWIDAVPSDLPLPAMPGFDRDWVDSLLALSTAQAQEPAAVIGKDWRLLWASADSLKAIVDRTGLQIGDNLYASPPAPSTPDARAIVEQYADHLLNRSMKLAEMSTHCRSGNAGTILRGKSDLLREEAAAIRALPLPTPSAPDAALRQLRDTFTRWLEEGPNSQPVLPSGMRPWSTGDLKWLVGQLNANLSNSGQMEEGA